MTRFFSHLQHSLQRWQVEKSASWVEIFDVCKSYNPDQRSIRHIIAQVGQVFLFPAVLVSLAFSRSLRLLSDWMRRKSTDQLHESIVQQAWNLSRYPLLWIVYVPYTRLECQGGVPGLLFPNLSPSYKKQQADCEEQGREVLKPIRKERDHLLELLDKLKEERRSSFMASHLKNGPIQTASDLLSPYQTQLVMYDRLRSHLSYLEGKIQEIERASKTKTSYARTGGYFGLAHWAKKTHSEFTSLLVAIATVSSVGVTFAYATIFTTIRGNVGLICWTFALFSVSLVVSMGTETSLSWCASQDDTIPLPTTTIWNFITRMFVLVACTSFIGAITLVCASVALLGFPPAIAPTTASAFTDAPLNFSVSPIPAGYFALGVFGFAGAIVIKFLVLFWWGVKFNILPNKHGESGNKPLKDLDV